VDEQLRGRLKAAMFEKVVKESMQLGRAKTEWKLKGTKSKR